MSKKSMRIKYLWPAIGWSLIILVLTLTPGEKLPEVGIFQIDKFVHFFVFGLLMILSSYGLKKIFTTTHFRANPVLVGSLYSIGLGITVEILQLFVPNRSFSLADIVANTIGVGLGYLIFRFLSNRNVA
jgi:VanZ family protein